MPGEVPEILRALAVGVVLCVVPQMGLATTVEPRELSVLVDEADHVIEGTVVLVDMVDGEGAQVTDPDDGTGPGLDNTIRLHIAPTTVLKGDVDAVPNRLVVPLWPMWHYSLGQIREHEGQKGIFLLRGAGYERVYPRLFHRPLSERDEIVEAIQDSDEPEESEEEQ